MAVVLGWGAGQRACGGIGTFNPAMLVHGEQGVTLHQPIPVEGGSTLESQDRRHLRQGQGRRRRHRDARPRSTSDGEPLFTTRTRRPSSAARAAGAATAGPSGPPQRAARARRPTTRSPTRPARPGAASTGCRATATRCTPTRRSRRWAASTARSCTACAPTASPAGPCCTRCAARDPARFQHIEGRFSSPVLPGEALTVKMWETGDGEAVFTTSKQDGTVVIDQGACATRLIADASRSRHRRRRAGRRRPTRSERGGASVGLAGRGARRSRPRRSAMPALGGQRAGLRLDRPGPRTCRGPAAACGSRSRSSR